MKRLFVVTALLVVAAGLAIIGVRLVGATSSFPAAESLSAGNCTQPCWHGISPGATTLQQMQTQITADRHTVHVQHTENSTAVLDWSFNGAEAGQPSLWKGSASTWYMSETSIGFIDLRPPPGAMHLGDAIAIFGQPVASTLCWRFDNPSMVAPFMGADVYFRGNVDVLAYNPVHPDTMAFDPTMLVFMVTYRYANTDPLYPFNAPRWSGFSHVKNDPQSC